MFNFFFIYLIFKFMYESNNLSISLVNTNYKETKYKKGGKLYIMLKLINHIFNIRIKVEYILKDKKTNVIDNSKEDIKVTLIEENVKDYIYIFEINNPKSSTEVFGKYANTKICYLKIIVYQDNQVLGIDYLEYCKEKKYNEK
jgi:hypothetical protein